MADFERGQTFFDRAATNYQGSKGKYLIALSNADYDDDVIVCFVFNTESQMDKYHLGCNKGKQKFIIGPKTFSFITEYTSIMLNGERCYQMKEMYEGNIRLLDKAGDKLSREIKNCLDWDYIIPKHASLIKQSFKEP